MITKITIDKGNISIHSPVMDGAYIAFLSRVNEERDAESYRREYFLDIDLICMHTGDSKQDVHYRAKENAGVETTKGFSSEDWQFYLAKFKDYIFNNLDYVL